MYQQQSKPIAPKFSTGTIITGVIIAIVLIALSTCFYTVDTGERGVVLRFGSLSSVASEGLNIRIP
ncbi:MAG: hypothetical protein IKB64_05305, partial [Paludibacteraceae bacterium]|nr:hypothetical protein [Paludibacteraceae bacterium]